MALLINIDNLVRLAKTYEPMLQTLAFTTLQEPLDALGISLVNVKDVNVLIAFERKGALSRPYVVGNPSDDVRAGEIGKVKERELKVDKCVLPLVEHIDNYKQYEVVTGQTPSDNQSKRHPLEQTILQNVVITEAEDIVDAMFHSERDESDQTPMGMTDGFNAKIAAEKSSGDISIANGNLVNTGSIVTPATDSDTDAIDKVVEFINSADPKLKKSGNLLIDPKTLYFAILALQNKTDKRQLITFQLLQEYIRNICLTPNLNILTHTCLGEGGELILTPSYNLELGMRNITDKDYIQVRNPFQDPNWIQFWGQFEIGTRIRLINRKVFQVNDNVNTAVGYSGDYRAS